MASPDRSGVLLLLNTTGRQSISIARAASAVGYTVRAHISDSHKSPLVAGELEDLAKTTIFEGDLQNTTFRSQLFHGVKLAFINTTSFDEEEKIGKACVDLAQQNEVSHVIYSSMPNHEAGDTGKHGWPCLPQWSGKAKVEQYALDKLRDKVTIVHTGIYHNNFTSLPYPLFQMHEVLLGPHGEWRNGEAMRSGSSRGGSGNGSLRPGISDSLNNPNSPMRRRGNLGFEWTAPFPASKHLPWLDCEHDFGAAMIQIFKDGASKWGGRRLPIASAYLTPLQVCDAFSKALHVPIRYVEGPITVSVPIPDGYEKELQELQKAFGVASVDGLEAPYWWTGFFAPLVTGSAGDSSMHPAKDERDATVRIIRRLWPGWRSMEGYAGEAFVEEERFNGRIWMLDEGDEGSGTVNSEDNEDNDNDDDDPGLEIATVMPL